MPVKLKVVFLNCRVCGIDLPDYRISKQLDTKRGQYKKSMCVKCCSKHYLKTFHCVICGENIGLDFAKIYCKPCLKSKYWREQVKGAISVGKLEIRKT